MGAFGASSRVKIERGFKHCGDTVDRRVQNALWSSDGVGAHCGKTKPAYRQPRIRKEFLINIILTFRLPHSVGSVAVQ